MTVDARFELSESGLDSLLRSPAGAVGRYMALLGESTAAAARALAPVESGRLRASISSTVDSDLTVTVSADTEYALPVHEGSRPHVITPRRAKVLRFPTKGGRVVYTTKVRHPGTRAQPFLVEALKSTIRT